MNLLLKKKMSVSTALTLIFIACAVVSSISYSLAMRKFNKVFTYNQEKQKMYSQLSKIDNLIRQECIVEIDELSIISGICNGYIDGLGSEFVKIFTKDDYKQYLASNENLGDSLFLDTVGEDIGYIRIKHFGKNSADNLIKNIENFEEKKFEKIILDLRNVSCGEFSEVSKVLEFLIPQGDVVTSIDKNGVREVVCKSTSEGITFNLVILTNGETGGVLELVPSAAKDANVARIVGTSTKGQAFKEEKSELFDDYVLILPIANYVTAGGEILFQKGVKPNIQVEMSAEKGELFRNNELNFEDDDQLQKALGILRE